MILERFEISSIHNSEKSMMSISLTLSSYMRYAFVKVMKVMIKSMILISQVYDFDQSSNADETQTIIFDDAHYIKSFHIIAWLLHYIKFSIFLNQKYVFIHVLIIDQKWLFESNNCDQQQKLRRSNLNVNYHTKRILLTLFIY